MTRTLALDDITILRRFIGPAQMAAILHGSRGEEADFFRAKISDIAAMIRSMPKTYDQDGKGDSAIVTLHYFKGGMDWYITEKDMETPDQPGQHQAYGLANLGYGGEMGYIDIVELIRAGVELDLYFKPCILGRIRAKQDA